jgi:hypothetical protein
MQPVMWRPYAVPSADLQTDTPPQTLISTRSTSHAVRAIVRGDPETHNRSVTVNRTQAVVLGFGVLAWLSLVGTLVAAPDVLDGVLKLPPVARRAGELAFLIALSTFLALLGVGVVRRWRWTFWLVLVAFLAGLLRAPASVLQLTGVLPSNGPTWYTLLQAAIGLIQFAIGLAMLAGLRKAGPWGAF